MSSSKNWCFTLNNYAEADVTRLSSLGNTVDYIIFGKETGDSGTPHLQGFVVFRSRKRLSAAIAVLGQCHCSIARKISNSIEYCKKEGDFTTFGSEPVQTPGQRNDLESFKEAVKSGTTNLKDLRELHSEVMAKYPRFAALYIRDLIPAMVRPVYPLRTWQADLNRTLNLSPSERTIIFIVDRVGNKGKSWFFHYYCGNHDDAQVIIPGKKADMAYMLEETHRVYLFDCPRSKQGDFIQYDFLEEVKNGYVFSSKYESRIKEFKQPHVVVAMNEEPDMNKLSNDRYEIVELN